MGMDDRTPHICQLQPHRRKPDQGLELARTPGLKSCGWTRVAVLALMQAPEAAREALFDYISNVDAGGSCFTND